MLIYGSKFLTENYVQHNEFSAKQKIIANALLELVQNKDETITYGKLSKKLYKHPLGGRGFRIPFDKISTFYMLNNLHPITAVVRNKKTNLLGLGFDIMFNRNLKNMKENKNIISEFKNAAELTSENMTSEIKNHWKKRVL